MVLKPPEDSGKGSSSETQESESEPEEVLRRVGDVSEEKEMESFIHSMRIEGELGNQTESQGLPEDTQFDQMDCFDPENVMPSDEEDSSLNRQGYLMLLDISKGTDEDVSSEEENFKFALIQGEGNCDTTGKTTKEGDEQSTISSSESEEDPFCAPQFGRNCDKTRKKTKDEQSTTSSSDSEEDPSYAPHSDVESDGSQEDPSYAPHSDVESDGSQEFPFYNKKPNSPCPVTSTSEDTKPTNQPSTSSYKKPYRLCIFCDSMKSKLSEHIAKQHHNIDRVALALKLATREKRQAFHRFKKEGILKFNKLQAKCSKPAYHRERSSVIDNLSQSEGCPASLPIPVHLLANEEICSESFMENVLNRFRPDEVGTLCTKDPVVLMIGKRLWEKQKRKMDKKTEVRRSVMTDMRRLSALYLEMKTTEKVLGEFPCKNGDAGDIFKRNNFRHLEEAISSLTTSESSSGSDLKAGLKLGIYYLLKSAAKIMKGTYLIDDQDNLAEDVDKFVQVLELSNNFLFGDATYKINQQRQVKLRKPDVLPLESDVKKTKDYTVTRMHEITSDELEVLGAPTDFVELRDLVVCRPF
ncbi:hypothetical protein BSL78_26845 [Apostichopus japonicus]|uniref:Uncharacterized protein n=1 Tax=Stichopus japonicus TaxID=307972 RepID=A0A2G8JKQ4_STIJA|nr:hypothetical protein BSL78_26845 [Apostichopus japonicus]